MAWRSGSAVRGCPHMVLAIREAPLIPPSAGNLYEITFTGRGALIFRVDLYCGPKPFRRLPQEKKTHIDRLVNENGLGLLHSFAVVHHKDSGIPALKKMPVQRIYR